LLNEIGGRTRHKPQGLHAILIPTSSDPSKFQVAKCQTRTRTWEPWESSLLIAAKKTKRRSYWNV